MMKVMSILFSFLYVTLIQAQSTPFHSGSFKPSPNGYYVKDKAQDGNNKTAFTKVFPAQSDIVNRKTAEEYAENLFSKDTGKDLSNALDRAKSSEEKMALLKLLNIELEKVLNKQKEMSSKDKEIVSKSLEHTRAYHAQLGQLPVDLRTGGLVGNGTVEMARAESVATAKKYREEYEKKMRESRSKNGTISSNPEEWLSGNVVLSSF